ncbi:b(o/a)3-type cytochrome-c oxidase subunit 1 [Evansella cellulosilytica]|uniref:Cytochrome c oxidase subunit I n=1 Tax=Evansella cellulosilytica (strain ATCC 21833 / DSM 2522 / FERM P-1141 / JCM 9156 / N-4) TaxID=649639 RepID=E6TV32_EVAC2|nr:b(o/a)3-type cytochrome-c oxidase subunit 1 [Evansella cellulosilytica]ADU28615.1 cytochrome c oxidase subunit I [Evansella cellulosilytica DSM 2522]
MGQSNEALQNLHDDYTLQVDPKIKPLSMIHVSIAFVAFIVGVFGGLLQGLARGGMIELPSWLGYYQILTLHGVLLALVFTTYIIFGFFFAGMSRTHGAFSDRLRKLGWAGFIVLTLGTVICAFMILTNQASVLYTFYTPLQAHWLFYAGLVLFVVGTWLEGTALLAHFFKWKKANPGKPTPLFGYMTTATILLWFIASIGVAVSVLFLILPWAMGITDEINVVLSRTLFWYFGHPLVYFWLMPAYMVWYISIPKIIGGRLFSGSLAKLAFALFLLFSIPVGFHHQLMEAGISEFWKYLQTVLTFIVVVPSLLTAFSIFATFEQTGRAKGGKGLLSWIKKLPWGDARFFAPFMGMIIFIPAGAGGLINASFQLNAVVHNTLWVVGHFHLTVGTTVLLTFFGMAYWLIPVLTGRKFDRHANRCGIVQTWLWATGMFLMSGAMHLLGLLGAPRRTAYTTYIDHPQALQWFEGIFTSHVTVAIGGVILTAAGVLMFYNFIYLGFLAPKGQTEFPVTPDPLDTPSTPRFLESWKLWIGIAIALILFAYTIPIIHMIIDAPPGSPVFNYLIQ